MIVERPCPRCGRIIYEPERRRPGRPKRWCSRECRRAASEERRAAASGATAIKYIEPEVSLDEHVRAVLKSPAACRRVLRRIGDLDRSEQLRDGKWGSVASELERLRSLPIRQTRWIGR